MKKTIVEEIAMEPAIETDQPTVDLKAARNYIDNERLYNDFVWFHAEYQKFKDGIYESPPRMTEYMGEAFIKIAHGYSNHHRFRGYTNAWKEEMVGDVIEAMVRYSKAFDPARSKSPFSYLTYIAHTAMIKRIKTEKRQQYVKYKMFDACGGFSAQSDSDFSEMGGTELTDQYMNALEFINHFETSPAYLGKKPVEAPIAEEPVKKVGLDAILED